MHLLLSDTREGELLIRLYNYFTIICSLDRDRLFYTVYEKISVAPKAIVPHLWSYRSRVTLEHLFQTLQAQKKTCPILHDFLKEVRN